MFTGRHKSTAVVSALFVFCAMAVSSPLAQASPPSLGDSSSTANVESESDLQPQGERQWYGETPEDVDILAQQLGDIVDRHREEFAGLALAFDRQSVNVYAVSETYMRDIPELAEILKTHSDRVQVIPVGHSYADLLEVQELYADELEGKGLVSAAVDIVNNGITLVVEDGSSAETLAHSQLRSLDDDIKISVEAAQPAKDAAGRYSDSPKFYMGGEIVGNSTCSLGIPVTVNGTSGVLTAGHCGGITFTTPTGRFVGSQYTTSYPGNGKIYGDWKILYKGSYAPHIFNGAANTNSTSNLKISGAAKRWPGQEVCHSGRTTGQICRYVVSSVDTSFTVANVESTHQTTLYHDSNRDGKSDCNGWAGGDSGGPIYSLSSKGDGSVDVHGIVKGSWRNSSGKCGYSFTQLSGVYAWNANTQVQHY